MDITKIYSLEEKISYLKNLGYSIELEPYTMYYDVYHNDIEKVVEKVYVVRYDKQYYHKPCSNNFSKRQWVDDVFQEEIIKKIKELLK